MSDISRTMGKVPPKPLQKDGGATKSEAVKQAPPQENTRIFAQKMKKDANDKTPSAKRDLKSPSLSSVMRQAEQKAQQKIGHSAQQGEHALRGAPKDGEHGNVFASSVRSRDEKREKTASQKADNILQGLQSQPTAAQPLAAAATTGAEQTSAPASTNRLFHEFQQVADRVMHSSQSLQQGGSIRLQLANNVLPGTSVTFSMVAGALHVTFSGSNKKSLDKVRDNKEGMVSHVRKQSGVNIVVSTENEDDDQPDQQGSNR